MREKQGKLEYWNAVQNFINLYQMNSIQNFGPSDAPYTRSHQDYHHLLDHSRKSIIVSTLLRLIERLGSFLLVGIV